MVGQLTFLFLWFISFLLSVCLYTEQDAFNLVVELMDGEGCNLRSIYRPGLGELQEMLLQLDSQMEAVVPRVSQLFRECHVETMLFATNWILTLYASSFPIVMTCRLIDIMLSEGNKSILLRVALSILKVRLVQSISILVLMGAHQSAVVGQLTD